MTPACPRKTPPAWMMGADEEAVLPVRHVAIVGPTASGKSALALKLAGSMDHPSIFSMDAFQVYRGMEIGTGKVPPGERSGIPHYLLDVVEPGSAYSVADYLRDAAAAMTEANQRGSQFYLWVGGTGLYYRALREGLNDIPATDPDVQHELEAESPDGRVQEIRDVDPRWAAAADLKNHRRVIRALAVYRQTGRPLSEWQQAPTKPLVSFEHAFYLDLPVDALRAKIAHRVDEMWEAGWPDEVRTLMERTGWRQGSASSAIGYREVVDYLEGKCTRDECLDSIRLRTWQYAKRQRTWFRKESGLVSLQASAEEAMKSIRSTLNI
jgi:tRNA dimethylallyltransferase